MNASPAPIVSTTSTGGAGTVTSCPVPSATAPSGPRVSRTTAGPRSSSARGVQWRDVRRKPRAIGRHAPTVLPRRRGARSTGASRGCHHRPMDADFAAGTLRVE